MRVSRIAWTGTPRELQLWLSRLTLDRDPDGRPILAGPVLTWLDDNLEEQVIIPPETLYYLRGRPHQLAVYIVKKIAIHQHQRSVKHATR